MIPDQGAWGSVLRHISTSSAVNPAMLVSISAMIFGLLGLEFCPPEVAWVFTVVTLAPLVVFLFQVILFSMIDRDRLQNDKHVERKMMITKNVIGVMEGDNPKEIALPSSTQYSPNPMITEGDM